MKKDKYRVLLIDDHPIARDAYKDALNYIESSEKNVLFEIEEAGSCDEATDIVQYLLEKDRWIDVVFLDISLPASKDVKIVSGEDLGLWISTKMPNIKIIVSTAFNDNYRMYNIMKNLDPDGFLIKNDITSKELVEAIKVVINDPPYYSKTVLKLIRLEVSNEFVLDSIDRKLLYELSVGTMMKDIPDILHLSIAGIEKRKRKLKGIFNLETSTNKELLEKAKEKGFL